VSRMPVVFALSLVVALTLACSTGGPPPQENVTAVPPNATVPGGPTGVAAPGILPTPTPVPPPPTPTRVIPQPTFTAGPTQAMTTAAVPTVAPTAESAAEDMVIIPAGEFSMGSDSHEQDERPAHTVNLPAFAIDRFEVTNDQYLEFITATGQKPPAHWTNGQIPADKGNHPVVFVTWDDAKAYCEWAGKRLPTEAEWEKAARGTDGRDYPWGNEWDPKKANTKDSGIRGTTAVGSFPAGASPYGVMDMAGNVWEWVEDWYKAYPGSTYQSGYFGERFRVDRGGGWFSEADLARTSNRSSSSHDLANDDVGFRCARDVEQ
jgi:formylglycine-generating enzyme required for sulfatase activity